MCACFIAARCFRNLTVICFLLQRTFREIMFLQVIVIAEFKKKMYTYSAWTQLWILFLDPTLTSYFCLGILTFTPHFFYYSVTIKLLLTHINMSIYAIRKAVDGKRKIPLLSILLTYLACKWLHYSTVIFYCECYLYTFHCYGGKIVWKFLKWFCPETVSNADATLTPTV